MIHNDLENERREMKTINLIQMKVDVFNLNVFRKLGVVDFELWNVFLNPINRSDLVLFSKASVAIGFWIKFFFIENRK